MDLKFISLASGSSGNCFYIGTQNYGFLIDAGIGVRTIRKRLADAGLSFEKLRAVFITHDHIDHIKSAGTLSVKCFLPIYATAKTHSGMDRNPMMKQKIAGNRNIIEKNTPLQFDDFTIEAFEVSHDGHDNVGYSITFEDKHFVLATDLGYISESVEKYLCSANYLVLEANYDEKMLAEGFYPEYLQKRISSNSGHLSNTQTAEFLSTHTSKNLHQIWLCHLSAENNTPDLAYKTVATQMKKVGVDLENQTHLHVLPRTSPTEVFTL